MLLSAFSSNITPRIFLATRLLSRCRRYGKDGYIRAARRQGAGRNRLTLHSPYTQRWGVFFYLSPGRIPQRSGRVLPSGGGLLGSSGFSPRQPRSRRTMSSSVGSSASLPCNGLSDFLLIPCSGKLA